MSHDETEGDLVRRVSNLETTIYGPYDNRERGIASRFMMTEASVKKIESRADWIIVLLITGIITAVMNLVLTNNRSASAPNSQSTSVITSDAASKAAAVQPESHRDYFLVSEVAKIEGVTDRTIINWIDEKKIIPFPTETSKGWQIKKHYTIPENVAASKTALPKSSEEYGNLPKLSENSGTPEPAPP